jgi:hypothetical protein
MTWVVKLASTRSFRLSTVVTDVPDNLSEFDSKPPVAVPVKRPPFYGLRRGPCIYRGGGIVRPWRDDKTMPAPAHLLLLREGSYSTHAHPASRDRMTWTWLVLSGAAPTTRAPVTRFTAPPGAPRVLPIWLEGALLLLVSLSSSRSGDVVVRSCLCFPCSSQFSDKVDVC